MATAFSPPLLYQPCVDDTLALFLFARRYIHHINPGTPASRYVDVGLQPRLVLVAVNKRSVQGQSYEQVAHEFTNAPRPLVLNFQGRIILDDEASSATDSLVRTKILAPVQGTVRRLGRLCTVPILVRTTLAPMPLGRPS